MMLTIIINIDYYFLHMEYFFYFQTVYGCI